MEWLRRSRAASAEAVLVAALVGVVEAVTAAQAMRRGSPGEVLVLAALATLGWAVAALGARALLAGLARATPLGRLAAGGGARAVAAGRAALGLVAAIAFGWLAFHAIAWVHVAYRFRDAGPVALLLVGVLVPLALALIALVVAIDRRLAPRLARTHLDGRRAIIAAVAAALVGLALPPLVVARAVPAVALDGAALGALLVVGVAASRGRGRRRAVQVAALGVAVLAGAGSLLVGGSADARAVAVEQGLASRATFGVLAARADGDGDGYAGAALGGADCDDADPARHPRAIDIAGNGRDENCTGADAAPAVSAPAPAAAGERLDIVIISIDALRADHLGAYGYARPTSPNLDAFAAGATRYAWALTPSPSTRHALPALLSGRYASLVDRAGRPPALAEALQAAGYTTAAILCCDHVVAPDVLRGFASVDGAAEASRMTDPGMANAETVVATAIRWLDARPLAAPPHFLWLHLYDPHYPYVTPAGDPPFGDRAIDHYDAEIRRTDRALAPLFARIDPARTIVVVTADHGEEHGEHGLRFHARSLYNQVIRVPLLVRMPGQAGAVVDTPVSLVDVMPTLLERTGLAVPGLSGRSLRTAAPRPVLLELPSDRTIKRDLVGVVAGGRKVIWDREANAWSVYALTDVTDADARSATPEDRALLLQTIDAELGASP